MPDSNPMMFNVPKAATELYEFGYIMKKEIAPLLCPSARDLVII